MPGEPPDWPLVLIVWEDAQNGDHGWFQISDLPDRVEPVICHTVGWQVRENAQRITLAMSRNSAGQLCDLFTIPRGCILSTTPLGSAWGGPVDKHAGQTGQG